MHLICVFVPFSCYDSSGFENSLLLLWGSGSGWSQGEGGSFEGTGNCVLWPLIWFWSLRLEARAPEAMWFMGISRACLACFPFHVVTKVVDVVTSFPHGISCTACDVPVGKIKVADGDHPTRWLFHQQIISPKEYWLMTRWQPWLPLPCLHQGHSDMYEDAGSHFQMTQSWEDSGYNRWLIQDSKRSWQVKTIELRSKQRFRVKSYS